MSHDLKLDPALLEALKQKFQERFPDLWTKMEEALASKDPAKIDAVVQRLFDPDIIAELAASVRQVDVENLALAPIPSRLEDASGEQVVAYDNHGNPKLNPLYEAALAERLQFDGDIPELRHGPVSANATPAVGVDTTVSNPVALGMMLEKAEAIVTASVEEAREVSRQLLEESTALTVSDVPVVESALYKAEHGAVPAPLNVETPKATEIMALAPAQKKALVWKATSTTQGRRSALGAIKERLCFEFESFGFGVECVGALENPDYRASWTFPLQKGHNASQERFSHVETAGAALSKKLLAQVPDEADSRHLVLHVNTLDGISEGLVGWEASFSLEEP